MKLFFSESRDPASAAVPLDSLHVADRLEALDDIIEVFAALHFKAEHQRCYTLPADHGTDTHDADIPFREHPGEVVEQACAVCREDLDLHKEAFFFFHRDIFDPGCLDNAVFFLIRNIDNIAAVLAVNGNPSSPRDKTDNVVPGHGVAALGKTNGDIVDALDDHGTGCSPGMHVG